MNKNISLLSRGQFSIVGLSMRTLGNLLTSRGSWVDQQNIPSTNTVDLDCYLEIANRTQAAPFQNNIDNPEIISEVRATQSLSQSAAAVVAEEVLDPAQRCAKLQETASAMSLQVDQLLEQINKRAGKLTFQVPADETEVRAALVALQMDPNQVSYQDYVDLLRLQIKAGQESAKAY